MTTNEMVEVMNAYELGEKIQFRYLNDGEWEDCKTPLWNWFGCEYRVKPKNKYRPYKEINEFLAHWQEIRTSNPVVSVLGGCWLYDKTENMNKLVTGTNACEDKISVGGNGSVFMLEYALNRFTYLDGTPFGIKED